MQKTGASPQCAKETTGGGGRGYTEASRNPGTFQLRRATHHPELLPLTGPKERLWGTEPETQVQCHPTPLLLRAKRKRCQGIQVHRRLQQEERQLGAVPAEKVPETTRLSSTFLVEQNLRVLETSLGPHSVVEEGTLRLGTLPVGARLSHFAENWENKFYRVRLKEGWRFRWKTNPPVMDKGERLPESEEDRVALQKHNKDLLQKQAVEPSPSQTQGCIFKMFLVDKKDTEERRPVVNMRALSPFVLSPHFKLEGLQVARDLIREGNWFSRVDLKDAYLHVPLHPQIRPWFRYRLLGKVFQWRTIPFGFKDSPRMFQKLMVEALTPLRGQGIRLVIYLDDVLLISPSYQQCLEEANVLASHLLRLGFVLNLKKSELEPTQVKTFLGANMDSKQMQFSLPPEKLKSFRKRIIAMIRRARKDQVAPLKEWQSVVGTIVATGDCVPGVRLHLNSLLEVQARAIGSGKGAVISPEAFKDLCWWKENLAQWNGKSIIPRQVDVTMDVDASNLGLGAVFIGEGGKEERAHRFFQEGDPTHINHREMLAAEYGLMAFSKRLGWEGKSVRIRTDSTVALAYLNRMGGRVPELSRIAERIHSFALERGMKVTAEWIPTEVNLADGESRIEGDFSEARLNPLAFQRIQERFGKLDLDLFASGDNTQTPLYVSLKADPQAWFVDAFSRPIPPNLRVFANPPFILLPRLLAKIQREKAQLVLVAPCGAHVLGGPS